MKKTLVVCSAILALCGYCSCAPPKDNNVQKISRNSRILHKTKHNTEDAIVTDEERDFVREIEKRFNVARPDNEVEDHHHRQRPQPAVVDDDSPTKVPFSTKFTRGRPLPAVIAIEIVNDENATSDGKGKRTIDANLGYGYKTSNGYFYSHVGKPENEKETGKFMIYPYSQQDIPPPSGKTYKYHTQIVYNNNKVKGEKTIVEIQPSKAYQLVPIDEHNDENTYNVDGAVSHLNTPYEQIQAVHSPPPPLHYPKNFGEGPTTLYGTFNGAQVSGLSGHFPLVMPNYYVTPSQFVNHYPGVELPGEGGIPQKHIIPVIILRVPSSHIQNPTAELFPKLPHDNPYAAALNNIDLQSVVNQYLSGLQPQESHSKFVIPTTYFDPPTQHQNPYHVLQYQQPDFVAQGHVYPQHHYVVPPQVPAPFPQDHPHHHHHHQHSPFSRLYGGPRLQQQQHPVYEETQEEHLPFSENYPDTAHTRVIYTPQYQQQPIHPVVHNPGQVGYVTPGVKEYTLKSLDDPAPPTQNHIEVTAGESSQIQEQQHQEQVVAQQHPSYHNYHAHPYPKRQVKPSDQAQQKTTEQPPKKSQNGSRRLRSGVKDLAN